MREDWFIDWFDSPFYDLLYRHRSEGEAQAFLSRLLSYLTPPEGAEMMDLACGKGRYSRYLAAQGYRVTGIDISPSRIKEAKNFEYERLRFFQHDMRKPFKMQDFHYVFNFFTSFGYFKTDEEHFQAISNVRKCLKDDGLFLIDFLNSPKVIESLVREETREVDGVKFRIKRFVENGYIVKKIHIFHQNKEMNFSEKVRAFTIADFEKMLTGNQLQPLEVFGDYDLNSYSESDSERMIVLSRAK